MKLSEIKKSISTLPPKELAKLDAWLHALLEGHQSKQRTHSTTKQHEVLKAHRVAHKTYRLERVRCGKESCKCADGHLHGPYWYAYWFEGGKTKSQYIGKQLPKGIKLPGELKPRRVR
jgi:hypothetical protein